MSRAVLVNAALGLVAGALLAHALTGACVMVALLQFGQGWTVLGVMVLLGMLYCPLPNRRGHHRASEDTPRRERKLP